MSAAAALIALSLITPTRAILTASPDRCQIEALSRATLTEDFTKQYQDEFIEACLKVYQQTNEPVVWYCHYELPICTPIRGEIWVKNYSL